MTTTGPSAILLLSGGLDSFTAGAIAKAEGFRLYALTVRYGQTHVQEIEASRRAARALGVSNTVIIFRHLLPNAMVATMTFLPFILSSSVMTLTALDFLGFGLPPGSPSLGELLSQGKANVQAPWLGLTGFFSIAVMLSLLIFIGEAVRDAFDPRKTFR